MVKLVNYRDFRNTPSSVWEALEEHKALAILANGEPRALMLEIENGDLEGALKLIQRVRAQLALSRLRTGAARSGVDRLRDEGIENEVRASRAERKRSTKRRKD